MRSIVLVLGLALGLGSAGAALAQGPSFDCSDARSDTERAICASPELSAIEEDMASAYQGLAARIGEPEARAVADVLLARREACGADVDCVRDRLLSSMGLFLSQGRELPLGGEPTGETPALGTLAPPVVVSSLDAAPAPVTPPLVAVPAVDPAPVPDTVLGRAFVALAPYERSNVQGRLFEAGFLTAPITGVWDGATEAAILDFLIEAERQGGRIETTTDAEAHLVFEVIDSDAFERRFLGETVPDTFGW